MTEIKINITQDSERGVRIRIQGKGHGAPDIEVSAAREIIKVIEGWVDEHEHEPIVPRIETLSRIPKGQDNDNCKWATPKEQANNRRKRLWH